VNYDKEFIVCSLDLLSGLAEGLGSGIESLVCVCIYQSQRAISQILSLVHCQKVLMWKFICWINLRSFYRPGQFL
jgi:hypothetical protein